MNICYLSRTFYKARGGIESYFFNMAQALAKHGHNIHIVTANADVEYYSNIFSGRVHIHKLAHKYEPFRGSWKIDRIIPFLDFAYSYAVAKLIKELINDYKIDIVESPEMLYEGLYFALQKRDIPIVVRLHGHNSIFHYYGNKNIRKSLYAYLKFWQEKKLIMCADLITAVSANYAEFVNRIWRVNSKRINIIHNGIDIDFFHPPLKTEIKPINILYVGRLEKNKGIRIIAESITKLSKYNPNINFIFVGLNKRYENSNYTWRQYLKERTNGSKLTFVDPISSEQLVKFYQDCTLCVVPSYFESFGMVALEAMACGKPVIATYTGVFPEIIKNNVNGILIPAGSVDALVAEIKKLLQDGQLCRTLGYNARKTITESFTIDKIADRTMKLYEETISRFHRSF